MLQPLDLVIVFRPSDDDNIKTTLRIGQMPMLLYIVLTAVENAPALGTINGFQSGAEIIPVPVAHFDQNQDIRVAHDQIDLTEGGTIVLVDQRQSMLLQICQCGMLCPAPAPVGTATSFSILRPDHDRADEEHRRQNEPTATDGEYGRIR